MSTVYETSDTGLTLDYFAFTSAGVWNGTAYVTPVDQPANIATYRIATTELGASGVYPGTLPADAEYYHLRKRAATFALATIKAVGPEPAPTLAQIIAALSGGVTILSPGGFDGQALTLNRGEAYLDDISNAVAIVATHPSFNAAMTTDDSQVWLRLKRRFSTDAALNIEGVVESVNGNTATFSFELTSAQTAELVPGDNAYRFDVEVVLQGDSSLVVTPVIDGQVNVRADI